MPKIQCILENSSTTKKDGKKKTSRILLNDYDEVVVDNAHTAIIDTKIFNQVQEIIENKSKCVSYDAKHIYLLSGLLVCKSCTHKLVGTSNTGGRNKTKYYYYQCPNHKAKACITKDINANQIENVVLDFIIPIANKFITDSSIKRCIMSKKNTLVGIIKKIKKEIRTNEGIIDSAYALISKPSTSDALKENATSKLEQAVKNKEKLNKDLSSYQAKVEALNSLTATNVTFTKEALLNNRIVARTICKLLIDKIVVDEENDTIEIIIK